MLARWLRLCLGIEAAALLIVPVFLVQSTGWSARVAATFAIAAVFVANSVPFIIAYSIALHYRRRATEVPRIGFLRVACGIIGEWLALLAVFVLFQPFEHWWMGKDAVPRTDGRRPPILLVPGYACNRGQWWWLRRRLRARGFAVATVNLEPPLADIDGFAGQLHSRLETLLTEAGADRVALIAHSMGGLVSRAYLRRYGCGRVSSLITLGSPHHGTIIARFGPGRGARQMEPDSEWMRQLGHEETFAIPVLSLWSSIDEIVVPQDSSRLAGTRDVAFAALGHLSLLFSPAVLQSMQAELEPPE